jgi:hypothetical protein
MDLMVDPVNRRLVGVHGDTWVKYVRRTRQGCSRAASSLR